MFKVNNKDTRTMPTDFKHCSGVYIADFEKVNISWEVAICSARLFFEVDKMSNRNLWEIFSYD